MSHSHSHSHQPYVSFLPHTLLSVVNGKPFVPFQLTGESDSVSLAALAASQHQRHADLITLPEHATVSDALALFKKFDVTCAPIVQRAPERAKSNTTRLAPTHVLAVLSIFDVLRPLVMDPIWSRVFPGLDDATTSTTTFPTPTMDAAELTAALHALPVWNERALGYATLNDTNRHVWLFHSSQHVRDALSSLSSGLRHVLVYEGDASTPITNPCVMHMMSQGDLMRYIYTTLRDLDLPTQLQSLLDSSVAEHLSTTNVVALKESDVTLRGFRLLYTATSRSESIGAVPVINNDNMCTDTLSGSDIRCIDSTSLDRLCAPLSVFLASVRSASSAKKGLRPAFPMSVPRDVPLSFALEKLVTSGISRVWVVDDFARPTSVISQSDVMKWLLEKAGEVDMVGGGGRA